jgi:hypothetical protein
VRTAVQENILTLKLNKQCQSKGTLNIERASPWSEHSTGGVLAVYETSIIFCCQTGTMFLAALTSAEKKGASFAWPIVALWAGLFIDLFGGNGGIARQDAKCGWTGGWH